MGRRIVGRRQQFEQDRQLNPVPNLVFGDDPPNVSLYQIATSGLGAAQVLTGIGASPGIVEGTVRVFRDLQGMTETGNPRAEGPTIAVVPYTDAGWAPLLAGTQGIISEVGGRLSHGAIIAREYGIPAVMDVTDATQRLHDGQRVRIDGAAGTVEILNVTEDIAEDAL